MTANDLIKRPSAPRDNSLIPRHLLSSFVGFACCAIVANAQVPMPRGYPGKPPWADTASESNIYPVGDAIGVYTAVLDLYYSDGSDRPRIIVLHDTAEGRSGGPCPMQCPEAWLHKSKIKESTMLSFAKLSPKRPRIVPFGYRVPMAFLSYQQANELRDAGRARVQRRQGGYVEGQDWESEFVHRYPGAWGFMTLSKVGFDDEHTEALISVRFYCGLVCDSDENIFLRRIEQQWVVVERIPNSSSGLQPFSSMRYRGPSGTNPIESEVLYPPASEHPEGEEVTRVYDVVLDSLYSFHGESPRRIVITDWFPVDGSDLPTHPRPIEQSTLAHYRFFRGVRAPLYTKLDLRAPVSVLPRDSMPAIEQLGKPLEKMVLDRLEMSESSPFWLEFRRHYSGAWGMVGFTRAAFNDRRTEALVYTSHACGQNCRNDDTWLLQRSGEKWQIKERIPRYADREWSLDSLRYLGADADPHMYQRRRLHGAFVAKATGRTLPHVRFMARIGSDSAVMSTDELGRYTLDNLPVMAGVFIKVPCRGQPVLAGPDHKYSQRPLLVAQLPSHPGIDSTANIQVDFRRCLLGRRAQALAGARPSRQALASGYPDITDAAVYRGVFDALYPPGESIRRPVLLFPYVHRLVEFDFQSELTRLEKQGVVDSTVAPRLGMLPKDSAWLRPNVSYGHRVIILGPAEQRFLLEQGDEFGQTGEKRDLSLTGLAKEAYPGADNILSLSRIAYNSTLTQAIVQVSTGTDQAFAGSETMILHKESKSWRVVRRHVEREETSGDMMAGRCEPVDAMPTVPTLNQLERFIGNGQIGDADITVILTTPEFREHSGTTHYRFTPTDTLHRFYWMPMKGDNRPPSRLKGQQKLAWVHIINDTTGKPRNRRPGELSFGGAATIVFAGSDDLPEGVLEFDGPYEEYKILRMNGRQFFGTWHFENGASYPIKGYFCGRLR